MQNPSASVTKYCPILDMLSCFFGSQEDTRRVIRAWRQEVNENIKKLENELLASSASVSRKKAV